MSTEPGGLRAHDPPMATDREEHQPMARPTRRRPAGTGFSGKSGTPINDRPVLSRNES
ncbi:hypothetical protein GCM10009525_34380 [Streptosporangium amethystogenes subsp. fukuiense]